MNLVARRTVRLLTALAAGLALAACYGSHGELGDAILRDDAPPATDDGGVDEAGIGDADCTRTPSAPYVVTTQAGIYVYERPVVLPSGDGFVAFVSVPLPAGNLGLELTRFTRAGAPLPPSEWAVSSVPVGSVHPVVELPDSGFAAASGVWWGGPPDQGIWIAVVPPGGPRPDPTHVPDTDVGCDFPTMTFDGTNLVAAWVDDNDGTIDIRAQRFSPVTGEAVDSAVVAASGPVNTKEPRIAWSTIRHALAYFDASDGALHVLGLDGSLTRTSEAILAPPPGHSLIGYPALVWNGTVYGLVWETVGAGAASLHFATFAPDAAPVQREPLAETVALSALETGQVALAWAPAANEWGIAWRRANDGRHRISLALVDGGTLTARGSPVDLSAESRAAWHPSLARNAGTYAVAWIDQEAGSPDSSPAYLVTYGCGAP